MEGLGLEPYAGSLRWYFHQEQPLEDWQALLLQFLEQLGLACTAGDKRVLGHIKCLARLSPGGYIRGSKISVAYPADVEVKGNTATSFAEMQLTLNILVYGLPHHETQLIVQTVGSAIAASQQGKIEILTTTSHHEHQHDHHE
ncbi:MAG: hypothetical protein NUK65_08710 [Firmicutes bacterium]|nr:hypothetical protein [Bacillota bacterium]